MYEELITNLRNCAETNSLSRYKRDLMKQAADAIEELSKPCWIPVTERLPRDRQFVLVYCGDNKRIRPSDRFDVAILLGDSIFTSLGVTHWMPLPEPPKEET